jgi:hypothetical protein
MNWIYRRAECNPILQPHCRSVAMVNASTGPLHGVQLCVEQGMVWVTRAGDLDDHFLGAGDVMLLEHGADALVGVDAPARLRIEPHSGSLSALLRTWQRRHPAARARLPMPIAWDIDERAGAEQSPFSPSR